jgi:hypothetical protein
MGVEDKAYILDTFKEEVVLESPDNEIRSLE